METTYVKIDVCVCVRIHIHLHMCLCVHVLPKGHGIRFFISRTGIPDFPVSVVNSKGIDLSLLMMAAACARSGQNVADVFPCWEMLGHVVVHFSLW